jgi:hypothetical protein
MRAFAISAVVLVLGPLGCIPPTLTPAQQAAIKEGTAKMRANYPPSAHVWIADNDACHTKAGAGDPAAYMTTLMECFEVSDQKLMASLKAEAASQSDPAAKESLGRVVACVDGAKTERVKGRPQRWEMDLAPCFEQRHKALAAAATNNESTLAKLEKEDSAEGWLEFIETNRENKRVPAAAKRVAALSASASEGDRAKWEERLVTAYPAALAELPVERRILLVGPKGSRVRDLLKMKQAKLSDAILLARVKGASEPYKSFDGDEMVALKGLGFSDEVVAAMLEVTTKLEDRRRETEERQALRAEVATLKKMIEEKKAAGGAATSGETVQTKDGPMDVLASCGKRLAAIKLCDQLPFPASSVCSSSAESSFPCPK